MGRAKRRKQLKIEELVGSRSGAPDLPIDKLGWLPLLRAKSPGIAQALGGPGNTLLFNEADEELYIALGPFREACNTFLEGPYLGLPEELQWFFRVHLDRQQLAYYWVFYDIRIRHWLWPYCEEWAVELVKSEASFEGSLVRAIAADLRICLLLETVGERKNGYKRFGQVFLQRFEDSISRIFMASDARCLTPREIGRSWGRAWAGYKRWLEDPLLYAHLMPSGSCAIHDMEREAQYLAEQRYKKKTDLRWLNPWLQAWRNHYRILSQGTGIQNVQIDGGELVTPFRGNFQRYLPRQR